MREVLALCSAILVGSAAACTRPQAEGRASQVPTVAVARVTRGDLAQTLSVAAEFRPYQEIDVHAKVSGYVKSMLVDVGDRVKPGQLLAVLEVPELQDELVQDEASVRRAAEEINRAQADVERAQSAHEMAHLASTRLVTAGKERPNLIAQQDVDDATGRDRMAEAQVATAKAALASARQQQAVAEATQAKTRTLFAYARITAPFAGVITHRYADTGAMVQAGTSSQTQTLPLVKLSQNDRLRLIIPLPESAVRRVHDKEAVDVRVESIGKTVRGTVARSSERLDSDTRTMRVEVDVPNPAFELVPGMFAQASIALDEVKDALLVPVQAIDRVNDKARVLVVTNGGTIERRDIELGLEASDRVAVTRGLAAGDLVVTGNRAQLKAGAVVSPKVMALPGSEGER
jgi:RND family efflux transporter MFP subunit